MPMSRVEGGEEKETLNAKFPLGSIGRNERSLELDDN